MKTFSKQTNKWILSTALFAALGSQYYFSVSSNQIHSFEMSSNAPVVENVGDVKITMSAKDRAKDDGEKIDATIAVGTCTEGCESTPLTNKTYKEVIEFATFLNKSLAASKAAETKAKEDPKKIEAKKDDKEETATERKIREREDKEQAKKDKEEKEAADKEERTKDFVAKMEDAADKCQEKADKCLKADSDCDAKSTKLTCTTDSLGKILSKFQKKGKNDKSIDMIELKQVYNKYIDKDLRSNFVNLQANEEKLLQLQNTVPRTQAEENYLRSEIAKLQGLVATQRDASESVFQTLTQVVPAQYTDITNKAIDTLKFVSMSKAAEINNGYKLADQLTKSKKPVESSQAFAKAELSRAALEANFVESTNSIGGSFQNSVQSDGAANYYGKYFTDMKTAMTNLTNLAGLGAKTSLDSTTLNPATDNNGRNARGATVPTTTSNNGTTTTTTPSNGQTWGVAQKASTGTRTGSIQLTK